MPEIRRHILFTPFNNADEFRAKSRDWVRAYRTKRKNRPVLEVTYSGHVSPEVAFWTAHYSDLAIYVRGHGERGSSRIASHRNAGNTPPYEFLHYETVCDRLIKTGLSKGFSGDIKFYN